jgi:predicted acetyltransferase
MARVTTKTHEQLELVAPCAALRDDFAAFLEEFTMAGEPVHGNGPMRVAGFDAALLTCAEQAEGRNLPEGNVPASAFWLVRDRQTIVGTSSLRHRLNAFLEYEGGHIGYSVRPSERRKGYGTRILSLTMQAARQVGLTRVLVTCDSDNAASAAVIRRNNGILENEVISEVDQKLVQRYWIVL